MAEYLALDRYSDAAQIANRSLAIDPLHEIAHQTLIHVYAAQGRNGLVRRQYEDYRDLLARELGAKPSALTKSVYIELFNPQTRVLTHSDSAIAVPSLTSGFSKAPIIAILPIESSDEASFILGGALTSKLIAVLATALPMAIVDHRTISVATKHITSTRETAISLGARYVIEGCVRSWGGSWRVDASLIDVGTGRHLCSESFRHTDGDLFELADNFALRISTRFAPQVEAVERQRTMIDKVGVLKHFHRSCALLFHRSINFKTNARNSLISIFSDTGALIRAQYLRVGLLATILFVISPPFAGSFQDAIAAGDIGNDR